MNMTKLTGCLLAALSLTACNDKGLKYDASGIFETTEIIVSAQTNGEILQLDIDEGDVLDSAQHVGLIDTTQLHLKTLQLQAALSGAENKKTSVPTQIAALREQIATQQRELRRYENLVAQDAGNQKQVDDTRSQLAYLEKQLAAQEETLTNTNKSLTDEATSLMAQIAETRDLIGKSVIKSPIQGTILSKYAEAGELATQGRALFKLADVRTMYLRAYITAAQLNASKIGQQVKVYTDWGDGEWKEYKGHISWISDKAEFTPKTIQTRDERANLVYAVKIEVENDGYIKNGMYGEVKF